MYFMYGKWNATRKTYFIVQMLTVILDPLLIKIWMTGMEMNGTDLVPIEIYSYNFLMAISAEQKSTSASLVILTCMNDELLGIMM